MYVGTHVTREEENKAGGSGWMDGWMDGRMQQVKKQAHCKYDVSKVR